MSKFLLITTILFPLFLVGIFCISQNVHAQQSAVSATVQPILIVCGNNIVELGEECDNSDFNGASCSTYGYNAGKLSCEIDCTIIYSGCSLITPPSSGMGGGSGGGGKIGTPAVTSITFYGRAYPESEITLLKDAQIYTTVVAGADGYFLIELTSVVGGNYMFSVYSEDGDGRRSPLSTFPVFLRQGDSASITGIYIAPTIATDKSIVKKGDSISIFGQSVPNSEIIISINSENEQFGNVSADKDGIYLYAFNTVSLEDGHHSTRSKSIFNGEISPYSKSIGFMVGDKNIAQDGEDEYGAREEVKIDLNSDGKVDLIDFSILAYWYKRSSPPDNVDLNSDGVVNLIDFSIMAFYWTG